VIDVSVDAIDGLQKELNQATARAWALISSTDGRLFTVRPAPMSWSAAECISHLSISSEIFLAPLRAAIDNGRAKGLRSTRPPKMDLIGRVLKWFLEPPIRKHVKTSVPFVPKSIRAKAEAFGEFASFQAKLSELLQEANGLDLNRMKLVSPFDKRIRYNLYSAFHIVIAHQRRHLWQAEQAIATLKK
jgi:DinB family protein